MPIKNSLKKLIKNRKIVNFVPPELSVFINCPFDPDYRPILDAIVFASVCCGFLPRCAYESGSVSVPRIKKITNILLSSKYSIHDLSKCRGEGENNFARFNMPLELGIAMSQPEDTHDWVVFVPRNHAYIKFISDLSGFDPKEYDMYEGSIVPILMSWLATRPDATGTPCPQEVLSSLLYYRDALKNLNRSWGGEPTWADVILCAIKSAEDTIFV